MFERREIEVSKGEMLMLRINLKSGDNGLPNGAAAIVAGWTHDGFPIDENGNQLRTRLLDYGYATTSHKSQGSTCDDVIIGFDYRSTVVADAKMAYVAATRGRQSLKIFCDSKEDLQLVARRSGDSPLAIEEFFKIELQRNDNALKTAHPIERIGAWARMSKAEILKMMQRLKAALFIKARTKKQSTEEFFPLPSFSKIASIQSKQAEKTPEPPLSRPQFIPPPEPAQAKRMRR